MLFHIRGRFRFELNIMSPKIFKSSVKYRLRPQLAFAILVFCLVSGLTRSPTPSLPSSGKDPSNLSEQDRSDDGTRELQSCRMPDLSKYVYNFSPYDDECFRGKTQEILDPFTGVETKVLWREGVFLRENGFQCVEDQCSGTWNRLRQVALGVLYARNEIKCCGTIAGRLHSIADLKTSSLKIWETQSTGPFVDVLEGTEGFVSSEYISDDASSGQIISTPSHTARHEDMMNSSFSANSLDLVISSEVLEHVPYPYVAHMEIYRVLKRGGAHVFSVPYDVNSETDTETARLLPNKTISISGEPVYHGDPIRPEGILVYNIFGNEMVKKLCHIGFDAHFLEVKSPLHGVTGSGAFVFVAVKL